MAFCYLNSPFFLQCYKSQYNSFKIVFDLWLIKAIVIEREYFHKERTCAHLELKENKNVTFSTVKGTYPLAFSV